MTCSFLLWFFSLSENADHLPGEAEAVVLGREAVAVVPSGVGQLRLVDGDGVVAVQVAFVLFVCVGKTLEQHDERRGIVFQKVACHTAGRGY